MAGKMKPSFRAAGFEAGPVHNWIRWSTLAVLLSLPGQAVATGGGQPGSAGSAGPAAAGTENMVLIPAGEFLMGNEGVEDCEPVHRVWIDAFYLDRYEVTNARYEEFCRLTDHKLPMFWGMEEFRSGPDYPDHPVVGVSSGNARAYAEWAGKRLPTEAEWEYAARGGLKGMDYPHGAGVDSSLANFRADGCVPVGHYPPNGFGVFDMGGNVREWVSDYYDPEYYNRCGYANPQGPELAKMRVVRGGGWISGPSCTSVHARVPLIPSWVDFAVGFRCARDARDGSDDDRRP